MINLPPLFKEFRDAGALHSLVAIDTALDEQVFATKSGDLVVFLSLRGIDPECLNPGDIDGVTRRFETAIRVFDDRFRLYQYLFKRELPSLPGEHYTNPVVEEAARNRLRYLSEKADRLYTLDIVIAVVYEGYRDARNSKSGRVSATKRPLAALRQAFSLTETSGALSEELGEAREVLLGKVNTFAVQLREFMEVRILDKDEAFQVQGRLLNYDACKAGHVRLASNDFLDYRACNSSVECHREFLRLDDHYVAVLTLKEPPAQTFALMLSTLTELDSSFIVASEWKRQDPAKVRRLIQSKRRHFHNSKTSLGAQLSTGNAGPADVLVDDGAVALIRNLGASIEEIEVKSRYFGEFSLTVVLYEKDPAALRRQIAHCLKLFAAHDAQLTEERYNRFNAWLAVLPGNGTFNLRRLWLSNANYADLSLLFSPATGDVRNGQLHRDYLAVFEGSGGTPYFFNLHFQDVAHTFISGATGSGKSFLLNFLLTHLQKYEPMIRIFDLGGSYKNLTRLFGGSYLQVHSENRPFTINPFCLPPTKENLLFLFAWVRVLIESGGSPMHPDEEQDLFEQIENLYHVAPEQRRLSTLANIVHKNIRRPLQRWTQGGPYGSLFDNPQDTLTLSLFQTFDFEGMGEVKEALEPLLFYVLHRANTAINEEPDRFKVFVMDEAWRFFAHPVIRNYMIEALKTWRKKNACLILATQSAHDLIASAMLPVVMESCPTQIFLANPRMNREMYQQAFHLNDREVELIAGLVPKKELLVKRPDHSKVLRLDVDRKEYWIYTNSPSDTQRQRDAFERFGFEEGLEQLAKGIV